MIKKEGNFFEKHIEKIVLAATGIVSAWILFSFVIVGFNRIELANRVYGPLQIDEYILNNEAEKLQNILNKPPVPKEKYVSKMIGYAQLLDSALSLDDSLYPALPGPVEQKTAQPKYALPVIPDIDRALVEHIRAVAYAPFKKVDQTNTYSLSSSEVNDIDVVTMEFKYNIENLYKSFRDSFAGLNLPEQWRDSTIAEPVFAAVQLQRQEQLDDGSWSEWIEVPRSKIDRHSKILEIIEDVQSLPPGGMKVRLLEFKEKPVQIDLLQPDYYRIASANEEWFPPSLHADYIKIRDKIEDRQKRETKQAELEMKKANIYTRTTAGGDMETLRALRGVGAGYGYPTATSTTTTTAEEQAALNKLYKEYEKLTINEKTDLSKLTGELTIWVFDDTVRSGSTCRYRVRVGVFNPIAGTEKFADPNNPLKNKVILWSNFYQPNLLVKIPEKLYLFAKDIEQAVKRVTVTVSKYNLGYWYSSDFKVMPGDTIGKSVKSETDSSTADTAAALEAYRLESSITPREIDYSTGAVMVDAVDVNDWVGTAKLSQRFYFDMLYSFNDTKIERMPVGSRYWPSDLMERYIEIKSSQDQPKKPFQAWADKGTARQEQPATFTPMPGYGPNMQMNQEALMRLYQQRFQEYEGQGN